MQEKSCGFRPERMIASAMACSRAPFPTSSTPGMKHLLPVGDRPAESIENKGEMNRRMVCIITEKGDQVNENGGFDPAKLFLQSCTQRHVDFSRIVR
jgi:hypothetical protein